jgi:hypothetical protein
MGTWAQMDAWRAEHWIDPYALAIAAVRAEERDRCLKEKDMKIDLIGNANQLALAANDISWTRLMDRLREAGEIRATEIVARIEVSQHGLRYYVADRRSVMNR